MQKGPFSDKWVFKRNSFGFGHVKKTCHAMSFGIKSECFALCSIEKLMVLQERFWSRLTVRTKDMSEFAWSMGT